MVYAIKAGEMSREAFALAIFLQGGVNRHSRRLVLDIDNYLSYIKDEIEFLTLEDAIARFAGEFDGLAVFDLGADDVSVNLAATACAAENLLGVPRGLMGLLPAGRVVFDAADFRGTNAERQRQIFYRYRDKLDRRGLVHQVVVGDDYHLQLRDFAIARGYLTFFTDETDEDLAFRREVLTWAERNIPVYGWTTDEIGFVRSISEYGNYVIPMDWSCNHSYFGTDRAVCVKQKTDPPKPLTPGKHYLTIVVSDGDNVQWLERDFSTTSHYGQRMRSAHGYPMNWTIAPSMAHLCPEVLRYIYGQAKHDYFITGVSGVGYNNIMTYPREHLPRYAELTAEAMASADLTYMCMLDNLATTEDTAEVTARLDEFAKYDGIGGGIWELDPDRYESGRGRVFFSSNGKPFVSVRLSLWHPSNRPEMVTPEWVESYAERINALPVKPDSIDGYTVLNVHPWTTNIAELDALVAHLADHVEIVSVRDFLEGVRRNIPHQNASPET